jgi:hypothetical protein
MQLYIHAGLDTVIRKINDSVEASPESSRQFKNKSFDCKSFPARTAYTALGQKPHRRLDGSV